MSGLARRIMLVCSLALAALVTSPIAAQSTAKPRVELPLGEMVLSRTIQRPLSDGHAIVVTRSWQVHFTHSGQGISVAGHQIAVDVQAPEKLAGLAMIEEGRDTDGMFPILLSKDGLILGAGPPDDEANLSRAVTVASEMIEKSARSPDEKSAMLHYLAALQAAGSSIVDELPPDLFYPTEGEQRQLRKLNLPSGQMGEIELIQDSQLASGKHWLAQTTRTIVTRLAGTSEESSEIWTLKPLEKAAE